MKKIIVLPVFALLGLMSLHLGAQSNWCGIKAEDVHAMSEHFLQIREEMRDFVRERNAVTYVPVRFHLVAKNNGSDRPSERLALQALCLLNQAYSDLEIQFYLKEFKYINNTALATNPESFEGFNTISSSMVYNAINVFVVDEINDPGVAAYWQGPPGPSGNDWIVVSDNFVTNTNVLPHEVGHFFSLLHPFNGWEVSGGWNPAVHGNPVGTFSPGGVLNELVSGSNCNNAGDFICDTPADYMFGPSNTCVYNLDAKDPTGALLAPDVYNRMNYFYNCNAYSFTPQQITQINNSLFHSSRNYVRPGITPNLAQVSGSPTLVKPNNNEKVETYNYVELLWTAVSGANRYLVEISSASLGSVRFITNDNSLIVTALQPNHTYLWRVMAYNEYSTCANYSSNRILRTGDSIFTDTSDIPAFDKWTATPNPVKSGFPIIVTVESMIGMEAEMTLLTMTGQVVQQYKGLKFPSGLSSHEIPTAGLPEGIYVIVLRTGDGFEVQRVAVVQ